MAWYYKDMGKIGVTRYYVAHAVCDRCGVEFTSGQVARSKYCPDCQKFIYREKNAERQRRFREKMKNKTETQKKEGIT